MREVVGSIDSVGWFVVENSAPGRRIPTEREGQVGGQGKVTQPYLPYCLEQDVSGICM